MHWLTHNAAYDKCVMAACCLNSCFTWPFIVCRLISFSSPKIKSNLFSSFLFILFISHFIHLSVTVLWWSCCRLHCSGNCQYSACYAMECTLILPYILAVSHISPNNFFLFHFVSPAESETIWCHVVEL